MAVKILLADDHKITLEGLHILLDKQPDMKVVAEAEDGRMAVKLARKLKPDVVIMDVTMPELNGIEATRQILADAPDTKVLVLSMHLDRRFVAKMLSAGAKGYLLKDCAFEELVKAIDAVARNETYLSSQIVSIVIEDYVSQLSKTASDASLVMTSREREVLQLLAEGKSMKQVAGELHLSVKTVETYRKRIMDKLNIHSVAELTKFAIREGLTSL